MTTSSTSARRGERVAVWVLRVLWLGLPVASVAAFDDALDGLGGAVRWVVTIGLYAGWAAGLLATLVPSTTSLTAVRVGGPAALAAVIWAVAAGETVGVTDGVVLAWAAGTAATASAGHVADAFVDGSSYGNERRFALRTPMAVLLGPAEMAWAAVVGGLVAGPLLLAGRQWLAGAIALVVGVPVAWFGGLAVDQLSRRWFVFVPAGVVLHDPMTMTDPVLLRRATIVALGPVPAAADRGVDRLDLSGGAPGLVLELRVRDPVRVGLRGRGDRREVDADRIRVTPVRPGAVLAEARRTLLPHDPT
ncbi:MAG: hypothetical protein ACRD29_10295 [Acidimicrobiales bacterium]